jgi:cytochrome c biogenesis protein CcmG, thiol:disulfide interchange protein DsbE
MLNENVGDDKKLTPPSAWFLALLFLPLLAIPFMKRESQAPSSGLVGKAAPDFDFNFPNGTKGSISKYRGKVVLLNFWASWCGPCMEEMPSLARLEKGLSGRGLQFLGVNVEEKWKDVKDQLPKTNFPEALIFDYLLDGIGPYQVQTIPVSFLIDRKGTLRKAYLGPRNWDSEQERNVIEALLD